MKKKLFTLAVLTIMCLGSFAQTSELENEIKIMIQNTKVTKTYESLIPQIIQQIRQNNPSFTDEQAKAFNETMTKFSIGKLMEKLIPVYAKYYTLEDVKAINAFYSSPIGKKIAETTPLMSKDIIPISMQWSQEMAKYMQDKMQEANEK